MDGLIDRYRRLSLELTLAKRVVKELQFYVDTIPVQCPVWRLFFQKLFDAQKLKAEIIDDINRLADNEVKMIYRFEA